MKPYRQYPCRQARPFLPLLLLIVMLAGCGSSGDDGSGPIVAVRIEVTPGSLTLRDCATGTVQVAAYDAADRPVVGVVSTLTSTDPAVVTVTSGGSLVATGAGSAYIRATAGALSDSSAITVSDSLVARLVTKVVDLPVAGLDTMVVELRDCRGVLRTGAGITYTPLDPTVVSVDAAGVLTGLMPGLTYVRAAWANGSDSTSVTVVTHPAGVLGTPTAVPGSPFGIAVRRAGEVVVAQLTDGGVAVLPAAGGSFIHVATGLAPTDVATEREGTGGFVTNQLDGAIGRLNFAAFQQVGSVPMGMSTFRVVRSRDGSRFFVTGNSSTVRAVNASTGAILVSYIMEVDQNGVAESPGGDALYIGSMNGVVREISTATGVAGRSFDTGGKTQEVVMGPDGASLFVAVESSPYIQIWDLASGIKSDSILVGAGTFGMALAPDGQRLYATSPGNGEVYIIDPVGRTVLATLPVGGKPRRVAFNATGARAVISNENGWVDFVD